jgi:alkylation response protein AidB-like acyl-CoA dehydrogenase
VLEIASTVPATIAMETRNMVETIAATSDVTAEVTRWLEVNWDPDLTVGEWWERLGTSGWAFPALPADWYGKGMTREDGIRVQQAINRFGALGPPMGLGTLLAAPTIAVHGTDEQKERYIRDTVTGQKAWCQFFSEPGAGSDLAGLTTSAVRDGDEWVVNGQKVWTSGAQIADLGMLLARTDPDVPKHQGITYFACDIHQPGIDIRPLKEMTGRSMFNEVFLTDVRVRNDDAIGGVNNGWAVANTTLAFERAGLSAGAGGAAGTASPGAVAGDLARRVGDFVGRQPRVTAARAPGGAKLLIELARANGKIDDPIIRQDLMRLHTLHEIARQTNQRAKALRAQGKEIAGMGNMGKLAMSQIMRLTRDVGLRIVGPYGTLHAYTDEGRAALDDATGQPFLASVTEAALGAQGPSIYGGTDEIQHNIIGERVLGLPKEPNNDKTTPFRDLPRN